MVTTITSSDITVRTPTCPLRSVEYLDTSKPTHKQELMKTGHIIQAAENFHVPSTGTRQGRWPGLETPQGFVMPFVKQLTS